MPIETLKPAQVRKLITDGGPPGRYGDGGNLFLFVKPGGGASWVLRWKYHGRRRDMGLGRARDLPLADARALAAEARRQIQLGNDPIELRRQATERRRQRLTFGEVAEQVVQQRASNGDSTKTLEGWRQQLAYALPTIGARPVDSVTRADVLRVLEPIWSTKHETAKRVRWRIEAVLDAAAARELRSTENPARWPVLKPILGASRKRTQHHAALDWREVPAFMAKLREQDRLAARALEFAVLTAARTGEVLGATWDEIDGDTWNVAPGRMKMKRPHRVPLAVEATALLARLHNIRRPPLVFFGHRDGKPLSDMAMLRVLWALGLKVTVHGFRSAFRDWCGDNGHDRELAEQALAHTRQGVEAAYARSDLFQRRREVMAAWARFCCGR
jgi:integrase